MGAIVGVLVAIVATVSLLVGQIGFFNKRESVARQPYIYKKVADQTFTVFDASLRYLSGIGVQPSNWSVEELKKVKILPATFDDRTALGEPYKIYYVRDYCKPQVMDVVLKVDDTGDNENVSAWEKLGLNEKSSLGKRAYYSEITQVLEGYNFPKNMKNPCGADLPDHYVGYVLNGKVYVNGQERDDIRLPSELLKNDGVFIYGFAPNQWGYLAVTFRFLRGDENDNEYYAWTDSSAYKQIYSNEYVQWRYYNMIWSKTCPSGYINLGNETSGYEKSVPNNYLNFCVPAFKSDLTKDKVYRLGTEFRKWYGVDGSFNPSDGCVVYGSTGRFTNDLTKMNGHWNWGICTSPYFSDSSHIDSVFRDVVNRYLYVAHKEAWGGRTRQWLQENEPLLPYPQPNFWFYHSITFKDPLKNKYYQFVAYFYKFYTGKGCSPSSLGMKGTSDLTGFKFPSKATIWTTGWKWGRAKNPKEVSFPICSPSLLDDSYADLGTSQRFTDSKIVVRVLDNPTDASYYTVPIRWRNGKYGRWRTFNWRIETPIY